MFACGIMFWTRRKIEKKQRKGKPLLYRSQVSLSASIGYKKTAVEKSEKKNLTIQITSLKTM